MYGLKNKYFTAKLVLGIVALSSFAVFAANSHAVSRALNIARPDVKVQISGSVSRGEKTIQLSKAEAVKPGEVLDWAINSNNDGDGDAKNYGVVGQIPSGTSFIAGSANGDETPRIIFSIDGGQSYWEHPVIEVTQPDGTVQKVAAPVSMYTHVKFEWDGALKAKSTFNAAYRVEVK